MNLNKVFLFGNLTRDPELRQTPTGQAVATLGLATNSVYTDKSGQRQKKAEFHTVIVWGRQAEIASQYLKKGSSALIEGRIQTRAWQDKQGQKRQTTEIVCERLQLGPRGQSGPGAGGGQSGDVVDIPSPSGATDDAREEQLPEISLDENDLKADSIPF